MSAYTEAERARISRSVRRRALFKTKAFREYLDASKNKLPDEITREDHGLWLAGKTTERRWAVRLDLVFK